MTEPPGFHLDKRWIRQSFEQAADRYDSAAVLQREVGNRMLERLQWVRLAPAVILDVGCGTGHTAVALLKKYRGAVVYGLDIALAMVKLARRRSPWLRKLRGVCADAEALPLPDASCDLLFSNLTLQWCELEAVLRECRRVLKPGGLLMFSTLGLDTLKELRQSWTAADGHSHVNAFIDMHDIGDALIRAALAEPVMDMEYITLTYPDVSGLMRDLKTIGAHNATVGRPGGMTGKGRFQTMRAAYERFRRADGLLPATYEVVYGQAWAPARGVSRPRQDGAATFPLAQLRRRP